MRSVIRQLTYVQYFIFCYYIVQIQIERTWKLTYHGAVARHMLISDWKHVYASLCRRKRGLYSMHVASRLHKLSMAPPASPVSSSSSLAMSKPYTQKPKISPTTSLFISNHGRINNITPGIYFSILHSYCGIDFLVVSYLYQTLSNPCLPMQTPFL